MSDDDLKKRVDDLEKFITTSFPDYISGIRAGQIILFDLLIRRGVLKREEVGLYLDAMASKMTSQLQDSRIAANYIKLLRDAIDEADPFKFPDSTHGLFAEEDLPGKK